MTRYTVKVTREGKQWLAEIPGMAGGHTYAGNLLTLDRAIREAIAAVEDLPEGAEAGLSLCWDFSAIGEAATEAAQIAEARRRIERERATVTARSRQLVAQLVAQGWSVRDIAGILGLSPGRVAQIAAEAA